MKTHTRLYSEKKTQVTLLSITIVVLFIFLFLCIHYVFFILNSGHKETLDTMNEISNLSVNVFQEKVNIYTQALENMATFLPENLKDDKTIEEIFRKTLLNNMFDRLGVVTKNGRAFGYDRTRGIVYDPDFSKKDYFIISIKGNTYIGKPFEDAFVKNQKIILISVSIYDNEENICGILCGINKEVY